MALLWLITITLLCSNASADGVEITVVNPSSESSLVKPIAVSIDIQLTEGVGAQAIRSSPSSWHLCYALDGDRPSLSIPILPEQKWESIPMLDDVRMKPGTSHLFEAWVCRLGGDEVSYGYTQHTFYIKQKLSAHVLRMRQWQQEVESLINKPSVFPFYIEIGTSFFDTLAEKHVEEDGWFGLSVEPIREYIDMLPTRPGLSKVNAMVCPDDEERVIYTFQGLDELGLDTFFHGMSSSDPTHAWRTPELRTRVSLENYRSLLAKRHVPCITYETLFSKFVAEQKGGRGETKLVLAHLKVDAEGADVGIIRAALSFAKHLCAWPYRIDFEAVHAASIQYPLSFRLRALDRIGEHLYSLLMNEEVHGFLAYISTNEQHVISFVHSLGHWILQPIEYKGTLDNILAHTDGTFSYAVPWDNQTTWVFLSTVPVLHPQGSGTSQKLIVDEVMPQVGNNVSLGGLYPGAGESEKLVLELEELGYNCACLEIDCMCFITAGRLRLFHPECSW